MLIQALQIWALCSLGEPWL